MSHLDTGLPSSLPMMGEEAAEVRRFFNQAGEFSTPRGEIPQLLQMAKDIPLNGNPTFDALVIKLKELSTYDKFRLAECFAGLAEVGRQVFNLGFEIPTNELRLKESLSQLGLVIAKKIEATRQAQGMQYEHTSTYLHDLALLLNDQRLKKAKDLLTTAAYAESLHANRSLISELLSHALGEFPNEPQYLTLKQSLLTMVMDLREVQERRKKI